MAIRKGVASLRPLRTLFSVGAIGELTDGQLLERFSARNGEGAELAFAALVERHGPMVMHVCRGVLRDEHEARDAFQITFLVLARKAHSLWVRDSLGPWLHQAATRAARCMRSSKARRQSHERRMAEMASQRVEDEANGDDEWGRVLHEEINRLPDRYREPVVLCDLEGQTHEQAARHLGCPVGTVKSRLARGRERLRGRLERRGAALSSAGLIPRLSLKDAMVPRVVASETVRAVISGPAPAMASLTALVLRAMLLSKLIPFAAILVVAALGVAVIGQVALRGQENDLTKAQGARPRAAAPPAAPSPSRPKSEAEQIAERLLKVGSDLFDERQAKALASGYTAEGEVHLIDKRGGRYQEWVTRGRAAVEAFYEEGFKKSEKTLMDSQNFVDFARFVAPDLLVIQGRFRPNVGDEGLPFVQMRVKQNDKWLIDKVWVFLPQTQP
jgi:RNA polymerase sigma factor (sigma-70 family)